MNREALRSGKEREGPSCGSSRRREKIIQWPDIKNFNPHRYSSSLRRALFLLSESH